ncbi:MAG: DUF1934 domain-containing protein [Clostridia bacterium]|nr:DUF1934 domain-containing protein [Clostridia bacterium]
MAKKYTVSIKGFQAYQDTGDNNDVELISECDFYKADGVYFCDYAESEITGLEGCNTSIEIGDDYVCLGRTGAMNTQMLFMEGRQTTSQYAMPFGSMVIDIHTNKLETDIGDSGGKIFIDYIINIHNLSTARHTFDITIKEDN